ncbi:M81 family metallopeptidase [Aquibaculum arenosum]|uniref:Microcystinase C n=1 Tax=Aquibaculum arenosum TaxID=3032591 RepID=A0ABT5YKT2_9PROT|nr:M81 family metallopeptidase [Fodinicurvata sp. CAU 1616]MDF2095395.1 M81 family metallopeptidase [Fodinicurvata sp. CAU 1616]
MTFRVLASMIGHESNVLSVLPTEIEAFRDNILFENDAVMPTLAGTATEFAGLAQAVEAYGWHLRTPIAAWATPGGRVSNDAWQTLSAKLLDGCKTTLAEGNLDGILLFLHGAMATEYSDDAEGDLLREIREVVPAKVKIAVTIDLHANVTEEMCRHADILCAYRTYPHIDQAQTARRAAALLEQAMRGSISPRIAFAASGYRTGLDDGRTTTPDSVMGRALAMAEAAERAEHGVLSVSLQAGFGFSNLPEAGPSVAVTYDASTQDKAEEVLERFARFIRDTQHESSCRFLSCQELVSHLRTKNGQTGPIVIADYSDNPGGGAYGDSTILLEALLAADVGRGALATIYDPEAVRILSAHEMGDEVTLKIGGKIDPRFGAPLNVTGTLLHRTDGRFVAGGPRWRGITMNLGPSAVLRVGRIDILIVSNRLQCTEVEAFTHAGIEPTQLDFVVVKSMQHFRAAFDPIATETLVVDAGALCSDARIPQPATARDESNQA